MEQSARGILRRVGFLLIIGGAIDIGVMVHAMTHGMSYRSSFNVFAVIAGIFLLRGNLKAAAIVRGFVLFFLVVVLGMVAALPLVIPPDLMLTEIFLTPGRFALGFVVVIVVFASLLWIARELGREPVRTAYIAQDGKPGRNIFPIAAGGLLSVGTVLALHFLLTGGMAHRAEQLAEQQLGPGYKFRTTSIRVFGNLKVTKVSATVAAWTHGEVRHVAEEWIER